MSLIDVEPDTQNMARLPIAPVVTYLQDTLDQTLTAYLSGVDDATQVGHWAQGEAEPHAMISVRLRAAASAVQYLMAAYDADTAKAWLIGTNTRLDGDAPARRLRQAATHDQCQFLVPVARAFAGGLA
ncbi:MAG: XRE family transcriptional regulator [Candidatus Sericytochromatia bacterium]|nr:XRE family transcriptional regulator [Candidatus Sericytochromatia bacterium]